MPVSGLFLECWNFLYIGRHINIKHQSSFLTALFFAVTNLNRLEPGISFLESKTGHCHRLLCLTNTEQRDELTAVSLENSKHQMWGFAGGSVVKNLPPVQESQEMQIQSLGSGRPPGGVHGNPLQCSCLENPMDRETWWATAHRVTKNWTRLKQIS